jgi:hypothetical protein
MILSNRTFRGSYGLANIALAWNVFSIVEAIILYSNACQTFGIMETYGPKVTSNTPSDCLYFSVVTWTTLGYGDFVPTPELRSFAAEEALTGYVSLGLFVVGLISWIGRNKTPESRLAALSWKNAEIRRYVRWIVKGGEMPLLSTGLLTNLVISAVSLLLAIFIAAIVLGW